MRVLLINPWLKTLFGDERTGPGHPHLGLAYLVSAMKAAGIREIELFDQGLENDDAVLAGKIERFRPELVGLTTFSYCCGYASEMIRTVRAATDAPLVVGGPHVSAMGPKILEEMDADFAMQGEGEASFLRFLEELSGARRLSNVTNLVWRNGSGRIVENPREPLIKDVDAIPLPDFEAFGFERYNYYESRTLPIITSRGCPYNCNYCSVALSMGRGFRPRSPEGVIEEMRRWVERYGIKKFEINDDCFSLDIKRAERICDLLKKEGLGITYELYNGIRPDRVSEGLLRKMKDSGCVFVSYGCESGDQGVIDGMGKNLRIESVKEAVEVTRKVGIRNSVNFIIGHAGETYEKTMKSLSLAASLPTDFVNFYNVIPYPGTALFRWAAENAEYMMPVEDYLGRVGSRDLTPVFWTKDFTREERVEALKQGYALYQRTILRFRFGKVLGWIAYQLSRNELLFSAGRKFALGSRTGFRIYTFLTRRSRRT